MNCRLCDKDITGKKFLLLYDYEENLETKLGRKLSIILNSSQRHENLSNYCCDFCSCKIEVCFSLLVEIQASDEVMRQAYDNLANDNKIDTATQLFVCGECKATVSGIKSFIKHYECHILEKTIVGSKKDVVLSGIVPHTVQDERTAKMCDDQNISNISEQVFDPLVSKNTEGEGLNGNKVDCAEDIKEVSQVGGGEDDKNDKIVGGDGDDHSIFKYLDDDDDDDYDSLESVKLSSDEEFNDFYDNKILEDLNLIMQNDPKESVKEKETHLEGSKLDSYTQNSVESDVRSEASYKSDSSFKNLVETVKKELEEGNNGGGSSETVPSAQGTYDCETCKLSFAYKFVLDFHIKRNHEACDDLDMANVKNLTEDDGDEFDRFKKCRYCKRYILTSELKDHISECKEESALSKNILCQICGKMYGYRDLDKHVEEHKKLDGWPCDLCGKKFKAKRFLKSHLGEHDESKKKICEICGKKLLPLSFFSHIMKHKEKRHICQFCGKAFTYNYGLRIHLKVHDSKRLPFKPEKKKDKVFCWLCKKDFDCTEELNKHLKNDHNAKGVEQDSRFPCSHCEKRFADMFSLKIHLKLIHEMRDEDIARLKSLPVYRYIECNVCNKVFNSENKIRRHMKQDHGLKPFEMEILKKECEKCGKKFASKQNLIHHINGAHLHIKPMTCDICHEKFAKHSSLIYHKLRHSGEKPFQCEFCKKCYRQRNDVIRHLARHVRDKELPLEEASAVNNSPSRLVIKRRIFLKDSNINYQMIVRKNRRKSEVCGLESILDVDEEDVNEIEEEQMEFDEDGMSESMMYVEEVQGDENQPESDIYINAKPVYNEERNTIILSSPEALKNSVKNATYKHIPSQLKHMPAVIVKKQEQI